MAGNLQAVGNHGLIPGPIRVELGPKGTTTHWTVTCDTIGPLITYYNYIITFGATVVAHGFDLGIDNVTTAEEKMLEISLPGLVNNLSSILAELYFDSWELLTNESTDSIFADPLIISPIGGSNPVLNYNDKVVLSRLSRDGGTLAQAIASCNADVTAGLLQAPTVGYGALGGGLAPVAPATVPTFQQPGTLSPVDAYGGNAPSQIGLEIQKGQVEYESPTYVLRHTSYFSALSTYNLSVANTECIYTPAQLLTEVGSGWTYNLPPRLYSKISSIPIQLAALAESPYYTWGWKKTICREAVLADFKVETPVEYALGLWSNLRYALR
jgi:hypothetical protein